MLTKSQDVPKNASVLDVKRNGGAFQPFHREASVGKAPPSSSTAGGVAGGSGGSDKKEVKEGETQRKQRRCWSQELHKCFLHALNQLGGADCEYHRHFN